MSTRSTARRATRNVRGFTLIELITVVTIVGIVAALAVPSMRELILTQYVRSAAADLQSSLFFARSEAIKRAADVQVVPTSSAWTQGWTVQLAGGTVLRKQSALSDQLSATSGSTLTYRNDGHLTSAPGQIVFKTSNAKVAARCVSIDLSGRAAVLYDTDGDASNGCN